MNTPASGRSTRLDLLAQRLGHDFNDRALLRQAMVHRSFLNENPGDPVESNERLEFLGDAVLDSVVSRRLYDDYPTASEGWLTEVRSILVRNETLAALAREYDLGRYLVMGKGVEAQDGRRRPAILGRTFEAILGAVYLDGGWRAAQRVIIRALADQLQAIAVAGLERDPKSLLQQACQAEWHAAPRYLTVEERGPAHERQFRVEVHVNGEVLGDGEGLSKQAAEKAAAEVALRALPANAVP
jgi:ribonuclease-3